jgi:glycosyltransferase involved in cell wall biosynthesis
MAWMRAARARAAGFGVPLRIVLVEPTLDDNGAIRVSLDRAERWRRAGAQVTVLIVEHGLPHHMVALPRGLDVRQATKRPLRFRWTLLLAAWKLLLLARRADVIVAGREVHMGLVLADLLRPLTRRPLAVTVQSRPDLALLETVDEALRARTHRALVRSDLAVCVGSGLVPIMVGLGLPPQLAKVVRNGIDVPHLRAMADAPAELTLPCAPFVVGVGRLHRQKGFDVLLRAHARALTLGAPQHVLVLLGDGPQRVELQLLAKDLGIIASVHFAGFVHNPHAVVARSELFVLSSRWEGFGLVLAEALSLGVPVIATRCVAGPEELLEDGRFGRLVPVEDVEALATAITEHLRDPVPLRASATTAADVAVERFDPQAAADSHLALLRGLVTSTRVGRDKRHSTFR